ncbi:hypothetical protein CLU88_4326 [Acidovorax sp. 56]|uniref:hypothetical protein n=1 Tax=Acidovorax sp. 56 TaxID=2035205 RepID=UPI000C16C875|nr:hypothetical protein [Acidovorax sp. 56]PIF29397.1 hypothetical protein CLU88_4326 [Acidovorax sp. 56]
MTAQRLSPAMRAMLRNIITRQPSIQGLTGGPLKHAATRRALQTRGLLDQELKATASGLAVFGARNPAPYVVWHLIGPQACGKTRYAQACIAAIQKLGGVGTRMETYEFEGIFGGNPERVAEEWPGLTVLMIENNMTQAGRTPPHYMLGDRIIDLTHYLHNRRPGIEGIQVKLRLNQPGWDEQMVQVQAKHQYSPAQYGEAAHAQ